MNKFIPLSSLKDTTGIVELCNKAGEPVVVNRNGELKLVIMTKDIFNEYFFGSQATEANGIKENVLLP